MLSLPQTNTREKKRKIVMRIDNTTTEKKDFQRKRWFDLNIFCKIIYSSVNTRSFTL